MTIPNVAPGGRSALGRLIFLSLWGTAMAGCGLLAPPGDSNVNKDIHQIRIDVQRLIDEEESARRQIEFRLSALEEKVQSRNESLNSNLSHIDARLLDQNEEISALREEHSSLRYQLTTISTLLEIRPSELSDEAAVLLENRKKGEASYDEGQKQFNLGRYEEAIKAFRAALAQGIEGKRAIESQYGLADSLYRLPDLDLAYDEYTKLISSNPGHPLAWRSLERLADINLQAGRSEDALKLFSEIENRNPGYEGIERVKERIAEINAAKGGDADTP